MEDRHVLGKVQRTEGEAKLSFGAALRNVGPIVETVVPLVKGLADELGAERLPLAALEVASGSGQHVVALAAETEGMAAWQPTDINPEYLASQDAYVTAAGTTNVLPSMLLDASDPAAAWPTGLGLVLNANMIHISPWECCKGLVAGAGANLLPGGLLVFYGPFARGGVLEPESNRRFDESLRARDPSFGVRDVDDVSHLAEAAGMSLEKIVEMPANNLVVVFKKAQ